MTANQAPTSGFAAAERQLSAMMAALDALASGSRDDLSADERLDLARWGLMVAQRAEAVAAVLAAEADADRASMVAKGTPMSSWLALSQAVTPRDAAGIVFAGRDLTSHPDLRDAAMSGRVGVRQARAIARVVNGLPGELSDRQHGEAIDLLIDRARSQTAEDLANAGPAVLSQVAPELAPDPVQSADQRRKRARARRSLRFLPGADGTVKFAGCLPDLESAKFKKLIAAYRESDKRRGREVRDPLAEQRTPEQRNADALIALLDEHGRQRRGPTVAGDRPRIVVTMSFDQLLAQAEQLGILDDGTHIRAGDLRRLCCDADITPVVLGAKSEILDWGFSERLVTAGLQRALNWRDRGCSFPGCTATPEQCEAHHLVRGHEKVPTGGQVELPAGGQIESPHPLCRVVADGEGPAW